MFSFLLSSASMVDMLAADAAGRLHNYVSVSLQSKSTRLIARMKDFALVWLSALLVLHTESYDAQVQAKIGDIFLLEVT